MPTYTISTGGITGRIKTQHPASAAWLAGYFIESRRPERVGALIKITGGQYQAAQGNDMYITTEAVLQYTGHMPGYADPSV